MDPMIIFTEAKFVDEFRRLRVHAVNRTKIVTMRLEDLKVAKMFSLYEWSLQLAIDPERQLHKTYKVFWVWLNKLSFMTEAVRSNPFASDIFVWCDIGSFRQNTYNSQKLIRNTDIISPNKMLLMAVKPPHDIYTSGGIVLKYDGVFDNSDFYTAGALLAGYRTTVFDMEQQFLNTVQIYRNRGLFIGDDQPLLQATCARTNLCEFITPYHVRGNKWFGLQYALHTTNAISLWRPHASSSPTWTNPTLFPITRISAFAQRVQNNTSVPRATDRQVTFDAIPSPVCLNSDFRAESNRSVWTMVTDGEEYVRGAQKLGVSVLSNTRRPVDLVVLELKSKPLSTKNWARLQSVGWKRCTVDRIAPTDEQLTYPRFRDQFSKLHLWGMIEYKMVVYLDADTLVVRAVDAIFETEMGSAFMAAGRDYQASTWQPGFNMGVFVVLPSRPEYTRLKRLQKFGLIPFQTSMAEQGFLNVVYRNAWARLPFGYNANLAIYTQDRVYWDKNIDTVRIIHYTMSKPWACDLHYAPVCEIWLRANSSIVSEVLP